jgi:hypothetical protein
LGVRGVFCFSTRRKGVKTLARYCKALYNVCRCCVLCVAVYNEQPEQDSLNEPNPGPEPVATPAELNAAGKHRDHSRPKLRTGRALLGILTPGKTSGADMLDHTEPL